ncbi:hypothetical protein CNEO2_70067 [Clostridium neonatale]|nr:hypothetical protein CNEO2_70067 [Clostridium neonatale]
MNNYIKLYKICKGDGEYKKHLLLNCVFIVKGIVQWELILGYHHYIFV